MKLAPRETLLALATLAVALFAITGLVAKPWIQRWTEIRDTRESLRKVMESDRELLARKDVLAKQYAEVKDMMPSFPAEKKMDVHWMEIMDGLAARNGVKIMKRQAGEEKKQGDVYELPVECKEWEGTLEGVIHFLFDMQNQGAMLDVRQVRMKPQGKVFKGFFTLYCAYMRDAK